MLKSDLVAALVREGGISVTQAEAAVETIMQAMSDALCAGQGIEIRGFGSFHVKHHDGYAGRHPKTGQVIAVKPKRSVLFRTSPALRERMNPPPTPPVDPVAGNEQPGGARGGNL